MDFDKWFDSYSKRPKEYWSLRDAWNAALEQLDVQPSVVAQGTGGLREPAVELARLICDHSGPETLAEMVERAVKLIRAHDAALKASVREETLKEAADAKPKS